MSKQDILKTEFLRGRVSRRDFVSGMATFGLGAVAAGHLADDLIATARASEPKSGGHLNIATSDGAASDNLDPATLGATFNEIAARRCRVPQRQDADLGRYRVLHQPRARSRDGV